MPLDKTKEQPGYRFSPWVEAYRDEIVAGHMESLGDQPVFGVAVLELGCVDIELNITTPAICDDDADPKDDSPILDYFGCAYNGSDWWCDGYIADYLDNPEDGSVTVDWASDDWKKRLEEDMFKKLILYATSRGLSFRCSNYEGDYLDGYSS